MPILGWIAVQGWLAEGARRMLRNHPDPLPPLSLRDLGHYLREGAAPWAVGYLGGVAVGALMYVVTLALLAAALATAGFAPLALWVVVGALALLAIGAAATLYGSAATTRSALGAGFAGAWRLSRGQRARTLLGYALLAPALIVLIAAGALLCGVGLLPALVVAQIAAMHLGVQHYERYRALGGAPLAAEPALLASERRRLPELPP